MRLKSIVMATTFIVLCGCGGGGGGNSSSSSTPTQSAKLACGASPPAAPLSTDVNVQPVQVAATPAGNFINTVLTTLTICKAGTASCVSIPNIQVDTGSTGLRLLHSQINSLSITPINDSLSNPYGECLEFADGNLWGGLGKVDVKFTNGAIASGVTIQMIDDDGVQQSTPAADCNTMLEDSLATLGVNGVLGVGLFLQDCGPGCATPPGYAQTYYDCPGAGGNLCTQTTISTALQVSNPIASIPGNNNGVILEFPAISTSGAVTVNGNMIFGIDTLANNGIAASTPVLATPDASSGSAVAGSFTASFNGNSNLLGFFDSGSSVYFFADSNITSCTVGSSPYFCPSTAVGETLTLTGSNGATGQISITIGNAQSLFASSNSVAFNDIGAPLSNTSLVSAFDIGLPFFFGRSMYTGFENQTVVSPSGPFFACAAPVT